MTVKKEENVLLPQERIFFFISIDFCWVLIYILFKIFRKCLVEKLFQLWSTSDSMISHRIYSGIAYFSGYGALEVS